jgi:hypothetical protein
MTDVSGRFDMTQLMEKVIQQIARLPPSEQDAIANLIQTEIFTSGRLRQSTRENNGNQNGSVSVAQRYPLQGTTPYQYLDPFEPAISLEEWEGNA